MNGPFQDFGTEVGFILKEPDPDSYLVSDNML